MIAYKTFSQVPNDKKPSGIPGIWPSEEISISEDRQEYYISHGYTVLSEADYSAYKNTHLAEYAAWYSSQAEVLTKEAIMSRILVYQTKAAVLLRDMYADNTMAGISTIQSDQLFDDYADVLSRIKEGALPTALYRLSMKRPSGFVTQAMLDKWRDKIISIL